MGWYRIKRIVSKEPVAETYARKFKELEQLKRSLSLIEEGIRLF